MNGSTSTGPSCASETFGFIGLGIIAAEVAPVMKALGMRLVGWSLTHDPARAEQLGLELLEMDEVLRQSDVVSLLLRASPRTHQIIGERELGLMKPSAFLVNTGRGALVDETALYNTLKEKRIAGAAIDVFQTEPLPGDSPLLTLDNVLVTPHVAWVTDGGINRMARHPVENILSYLDGKPKFVVS